MACAFAAVSRPRRSRRIWRNCRTRGACGCGREVALQHLNRSRYYDTGQGRFLQQDTYRGSDLTPPSLHRYAYVNSNPIKYTDPSGESPLSPQQLTALTMLVRFFTMSLGGAMVPHPISFYSFLAGTAVGVATCVFVKDPAFYALLFVGLGVAMVGLTAVTLLAQASGQITASTNAIMSMIPVALFLGGMGLGCLLVSLWRSQNPGRDEMDSLEVLP